jgi:hypothetical protein
MYHQDKENRELWDDLSFADKLNGFYCEECEGSDDEEYVESSEDDEEEADY